jgi:succinyl-CoA synthetase alpha subunit
MAILVDRDTRLVVSGITGREGTFHSLRNRDYGTNVVAGVTPGKGGQDVDGIPVFNTFHEAVEKTGANTAMVFVPPRFAADSILEAEDAGIPLIITISSVCGSASNSSIMSMKLEPGTGSPPIPTIEELPKPRWASSLPIW